MSIDPVNTVVAGPVSHMCCPYRRPRNHGGAARQVDSHLRIQQPMPAADGDRGARPRAAGLRLAHAAFEYPQVECGRDPRSA